MQTSITKDRLREMKGKPVLDNAGEKIGGIEDIYLDDQTDRPEWIGLGTGMFGMKHIVVPLQEAQLDGESIRVPYSKDKVTGAPDVGGEDHVDETKEAELYRYYGVRSNYQPGDESGKFEKGSGTPANSAQKPAPPMTRSEEELKVGKRAVPAGQVRLRKWVETKPVSQDVELRQEHVSVERTPADRPFATNDKIGDEQVTMDLTREEPVVEKTARVKEDISLKKDSAKQSENVTGDVRKERVDIDDRSKK